MGLAQGRLPLDHVSIFHPEVELVEHVETQKVDMDGFAGKNMRHYLYILFTVMILMYIIYCHVYLYSIPLKSIQIDGLFNEP